MADQPWFSDAELDNPHGLADKPQRVQRMFSAIAPSYDLNNRLHSMGLDQTWRRRAVKAVGLGQGETVLDVACGTGDLSLAFQRAGARRVIGLDFTFQMLEYARQKNKGNPFGPLYFCGDAMRLPLADASVDVVSIAFGIRNVAVPAQAIAEFYRVLKPGGRLVILEFTRPPNRWVRLVYEFYFHRLMPVTAGWIAGKSEGRAYRYLPRSVSSFIDASTMVSMMAQQGLVDVVTQRLTLGIAMLYVGHRPAVKCSHE